MYLFPRVSGFELNMKRPHWSVRFLCGQFFLSIAPVIPGMSPQASAYSVTIAENFKDTFFVPCQDAPPASRLVRSPTLFSPDRSYSAYSEVQARAWSPEIAEDLHHPDCANTSKLFFKESREKEYRVIFNLNPSPENSGNGLEIVDWSKDGGKLAFKVFTFQYGVDWTDEDRVLIYDVKSNRTIGPNISHILSDQLRKACDIWIGEVLGFMADNRLVLSLGDVVFPEEYLAPSEEPPPPCIPERSLWILDWSKQKLAPCSAEVNVKHYGIIESRMQ